MGISNFDTVQASGYIGGGVSDVGNVYWVNNAPTATKGTEMTKRYGDVTYSDGTKMLVTSIADAITNCKGGRNDYVIAGTGAWTLTEAITLAGKSSIHLIGQNGLTRDIGTSGAALLQQTGNYQNVIMEAYGELAGFQIINLDGYAAVTVAANIWRPDIHNNCFHMVAGSAINIIDATGAAACSYGKIYKNRFATWVGGNLTSAINVGTGTGVDIFENIITQYNGTMNYGVNLSGAQGVIKDNVICNCGGGGVVTVAINSAAYNSIIGNRCAVDAGKALAGGTAANSFVDNMDGATGSGNGSASNLETSLGVSLGGFGLFQTHL